VERTELIFARIGKWAYKIARFLWHFRTGKENGYPTCCVIHFSWDMIQEPKRYPAVERGSIFDNTPQVYVPCGFHKGRHPEWAPWDGVGGKHKNQLRLFQHIHEVI
jgi:hypothetical protein